MPEPFPKPSPESSGPNLVLHKILPHLLRIFFPDFFLRNLLRNPFVDTATRTEKLSRTHLSRQTSNTQFIQTRNLPTNKEITKKNCRQARGGIKARSAWQYQGWNTLLLTCILGARHGSCEASKFALFGLVGNCKPRPRLKPTWSRDCFAKTIE